ncbi:hypothetical protein LguiB_015175 [Lonicera macranthoides]
MGLLIGEVLAAGLQLLSKVIISEGTFLFALMAYRHLAAALCVVPLALYFERGNVMKMSWSACLWLFMVALTGISMGLGFFYYGQTDTTATYATNFLNLIPIVTFLFSAILRIERLRVCTRAGEIKIGGAILCLGGALTISLYRGTTLHIGPHIKYDGAIKGPQHNYKRGTLFLVASILSYATRFIMQGALVTIVTSCLVLWAVEKRGPTYPSMFNPLSLILVAVAEALFLHQDITVGSLLGMSFVIVGLYLFLWAKDKEIMAPPLPEVLASDQTKQVAFEVQPDRPLVNFV